MSVSCERAAHAANAVIPFTAGLAASRNREMLIVGICWEMPRIRPSSVEISLAVGCSHSVAQRYLREWQAREWHERYGWLRLVEQWLIEHHGPTEPLPDVELPDVSTHSGCNP